MGRKATQHILDFEKDLQLNDYQEEFFDRMADDEIEVVRAEIEKNTFILSASQKRYAWCVLALLLANEISNKVQRQELGAIYFFSSDGKADNPKYSVKAAIPGFNDATYGIVAGPCFTIIYATMLLVTGNLADRFNRKCMLGCAAVCWSFTSISTAFSQQLWTICVSRLMLGFFEAFAGPFAYSLIIDYFPPEMRTTANSIFALGTYLSAAFVSESVTIINIIGWRGIYICIAIYGLFTASCILFCVKEPQRGRFEIKKEEKIEIEEEEEDEIVLEEKLLSPGSKNSGARPFSNSI